MDQVAKLFTNGRSQAVRLPAAYRLRVWGMRRYMLDTNTVSYLLREHPSVARRIVAVPMAAFYI